MHIAEHWCESGFLMFFSPAFRGSVFSPIGIPGHSFISLNAVRTVAEKALKFQSGVS